MKKQLLSIFLSLMALTGLHAAPGGDVLSDSVRLGQVEVVARKGYADVIPAQVLDGRRLERLNAHSVADAMRYFAGVQIKDYGGVGGIKTVDMRSMGTNHMGIFYDGIQLGNAQNGQIDLGKFSLDNMEQISLYNGQRGEIFQSAKDFGSAGTVYLQSRRPSFGDNKNYNVNLTFRTGNFGLVNPSVRFDRKISESVSATISGEYTRATGRYRFRYRKVLPSGQTAWDTTAVRHNGDIESFRLEGGLYGTLRRGYWQAKAYYYDSEKGIPGAIVNNVWKNSQRQWDRNFFVQGRFQKYLSERYAIQVNAKYARDYMRYLNPDTTLMYVNNRFDQDEIYVSVAQKLSVARWCDLSLSADWQWNRLDASLVNFSYPIRHTALVAAAAAVTFGRFKAQGSLLATFVNDRSEIKGTAVSETTRRRNFDKLTPALFASWSPVGDDRLTLRGFYKRIFRMPTFNDLYYTDIGNSNLRPEYATQFNLGATFHCDLKGSTFWNSLELSADAYSNRVTDKIIAVPKGNGQYRWMMMNIGEVRIRGIDVTGAFDFFPVAGLLVGTHLSYTYQRALDYSDPSDNVDAASTYRSQIAYIPRHSGSVTAHAMWREAELDYSFIYVGERYQNSSNIPENYVQPWYTHDLSASYRFGLGLTTLRVTAEVNNLFDQQYEVISNYPMPGRNFKIILKFEL